MHKLKAHYEQNSATIKSIAVTTAVLGAVSTITILAIQKREYQALLGAAGKVIEDLGGKEPAILIYEKVIEYSTK